MLSQLSQANRVHAKVIELGLDRMRCCLTGAPYATMDSDEVLMAIEGDALSNPGISDDRLLDMYELRALTFNLKPMPSLRGVQAKGLVPLMSRGQNGQVRLMTYLLTRLFYPQLGDVDALDTSLAKDRMMFSTGMYESAMKWPYSTVAGYVQSLVAIDSFCAMPAWRKLYAFESSLSNVGLKHAPMLVQRAFAEPTVMIEDQPRVKKVIDFLFVIMLIVAEKNGVAGRSGNRLSQNVLFLTAPEAESQKIPLHQKELSQADIDRAAKFRAINARQETRIAHSAIHGPGNVAGAPKAQTRAAPNPQKKTTVFDLRFASAFKAMAPAIPTFTVVVPSKKEG